MFYWWIFPVAKRVSWQVWKQIRKLLVRNVNKNLLILRISHNFGRVRKNIKFVFRKFSKSLNVNWGFDSFSGKFSNVIRFWVKNIQFSLRQWDNNSKTSLFHDNKTTEDIHRGISTLGVGLFGVLHCVGFILK